MCRSGGKTFSIVFAVLAASTGVAPAQTQDHQYSAEDIQAGYRLYSTNCQVCHGVNGDGIAGINLARQQFHHVSSDDDIRSTIATGNAAGMPPFKLQPREVDGLVAFIRSGFDQSGTSFRVGDAALGKAVYDGKDCSSCHRVNGIGARTAPDLSDVGAVRQPGALQRSLLDPTSAMMPINRPLLVVMADGRSIRGRRVNEDTFSVQLIDQQEKLVSIMKSDIRSYELDTKSGMPSYAGKLNDDEIANLLAYLISLKGS